MPVPLETLDRRRASLDLITHARLCRNYLLRLHQDLGSQIPGNNENSFELSEDKIPGMHGYPTDVYRHLMADHLPPADRIERTEVTEEHWEADIPESLHIPKVPVEHHSDAPLLLCGIARQLTEMAYRRAWIHRNENRVGSEFLKDPEVRRNALNAICPRDPWVDRPTKHRVGNADHPLLREQGPQLRRQHRLIQPELVHCVADHAQIEQPVALAECGAVHHQDYETGPARKRAEASA